MDKSKSRTDMLAAGRKKLQQFRQKKDNKGGGSLGKSSSKAEKLEKEGAAVEPLQMLKDSPVSATDLSNANQQHSSISGADRAEEVSLESKQHSAVLDNQEVHGYDSRLVDGHVIEANSSPSVSYEAYGSSFSSEVVHYRDGDALVDYVDSQTKISENNGGVNDIGEGGIQEEASTGEAHVHKKFQESNLLSFQADGDQGEHLNLHLSNKMEDSCLEENSENPASSQTKHETPSVCHENNPLVSYLDSEWRSDKVKEENHSKELFEDKMEDTSHLAAYVLEESEVANQSFGPVEDSQEVGINLSAKADKDIVPDISANEDKHNLASRTTDVVIKQYLAVEALPAKEESQGLQPQEPLSLETIAMDSFKRELLHSLKHEIMVSSVGQWSDQDGVLIEQRSFVDLESIRKHLYLSYIAKDVLHLQLLEQIQLNEDFHHYTSDEMKKLLDIIKETQQIKESLSAELMQCKSEIDVLASEKDKIETKCLSARKEIEEQNIKCCNLENDLHESQEDLLQLSKELAICRFSIGALQKENADLLASSVSKTDARKELIDKVEFLSGEKLKLTAALELEADAKEKKSEEKELLSGENMNLLAELEAQKEKLQIALVTQNNLQHNLREISTCCEQLTVENFYLSSCLDIQKAKIKEMESWNIEPTIHAQHDVNNDDSQVVCERFNANIDPGIELNCQSVPYDQGLLYQNSDIEDSNNDYVFRLLKKYIIEAKCKLQDLEKCANGMQFHSLCWSESGGRAAAAGVSKLIKAFESKAHVDSVVDEVPLNDGERHEDSYSISREQISSLSNLLDRLESELGKVEIHVRGDPKNKGALKKFKMDYEVLKQQNKSLQLTLEKLDEEVTLCASKINDLQNHVDNVHQHVNNEAVEFSNQIELLQAELIEDASIVKQERDVILGMVLEAIGKLDASTGLKVLEELDTRSQVMASVDATILAIETLQDKLEATNHDYNLLHASYEEQHKSLMDMKGNYSLSIGILDKYHNDLMKLVNEAHETAGIVAKKVNVEEILVLLPEKCEMVVQFFGKLLNDHANLLSRNNELVSDLLIRNQEIEELNGKLEEVVLQNKIKDGLESSLLKQVEEIQEVKRRCHALANRLEVHESFKGLYAQARSIEKVDVISEDANEEIGTYNFLLSRVEDLIAFHLNNYEEALGQINMSREILKGSNVLMEAYPDGCYLPLPTLLKKLVGNLHEYLHLLTVLVVQKESEIQILKEAMTKMEEDLKACHFELELKASEVEQSEQKLSSVREKLGIAVSKGKGLIVQRDGLKQSLVEKTSGLEKCAQELLSKEALIHELEAKLLSCSEVGRIEALESELSYIRNSATALRDSFLQKDSILQRIEEVLETLDLPDDFHDKDILEKVELLSRFATTQPSLTVNNWDKNDSEKPCSDLKGLVMEADMVSTLPCSNEDFDELKRKIEELQGRLYGLAEHNYMLEQSLLERNGIVQKLEEILDTIDMPSYMQTVDPEEKIEWIQRELAELKQERDSLQLKIDNLEISSEMLIVDLEGSHKKISELAAELSAVKSEKEFFSDSLEKLRFEYLALSDKAVHDELDRENLQRELDAMHDKLIDNARLEHYNDVEKSMQKLYDLVNGALAEGDKFEILSDCTLSEHLELSLKKLIDSLEKIRFNYHALSEKAVHDDLDRKNLQRELAAMHDKLSDKAHLEYYKDVENGMQKLCDLVDGAMAEGDKFELLSDGSLVEHLEESLKKLIDSYTDLKKSNNLISDNVSLLNESCQTPGKMFPVEILHEKEQELSSVQLALERASAELALVQQEKDRTHEKCQLLILETEDLKKQTHLLNLERNSVIEKYQSVVIELDAMSKLRDSLQEKLTQEEQKSAAVKEKLNLAVRKGKGLVQQRDGLKAALDEMNAFVEQLKGDCNQQKEVFESEKSILMNRLAEKELNLWDSNQKYVKLLTALRAIDIKFESDDIDPVQMVGVVDGVIIDLHSRIAAAEHEANKSKRAAELLLSELNEVQERNDILQEEVVKVEAFLAECSKERDDSLSRLEQITSVYSEDKDKLANSLVELNSGVNQMRGALLQSFRIFSEARCKDFNLFRLVEDFRLTILGELGNDDRNKQLPHSDNIIPLSDPKNEEMSQSIFNDKKVIMQLHLDGTMLLEHLALVGRMLQECMRDCKQLSEHISNHSVFIDTETAYLLDTIDAVKRRNTYLKDTTESLKGDISSLEANLKEKDAKIAVVYQNLTLLYEACSTIVLGNINRKSQMTENSRTLDIVLKLPSYAEDENGCFVSECVKAMADSILSIEKDASCSNELIERNQREIKTTMLALQREHQEKDIQMNKICEELISQVRDAETVSEKLKMDLDFSKNQVSNLEKKVVSMEIDKRSLESRLNEVEDLEAFSKLLQEKINSLTSTVNAKDQEIEALMLALDEEEIQMEALEAKNTDLENAAQQKEMQLKALQASNAKTMTKLSTTVCKFDELHNLSENLLAEIENLQSQVQDQDSEISFLRQEVTRCTNDVLASQETSKKYSSQVHELLVWTREMISRFGEPFVLTDDQEESQVHRYMNILGLKIASAINELEELRSAARSKDALLEIERVRLQELLSRVEFLETSLNGKERLGQTQVGRTSKQPSSSNSSGTPEVEQMVQRNKTSSIPITIRSGRKVNNDQIAIAIDPEKDDSVLDDEDDDKAHGFKPLTMSRLIPRATRPIVDRIDGMWVSAERLLMRQPTLRLALFFYWFAVHALLASLI
ncbi:hypothetical protein HPP92_018359 [Vanilla planifolia]|uniref:Uncharacterized protein n=1 Tax=Vanilla planifolia TaxID=51239 RepID=A0A835UKR1_VANPL|nr:hypothetical protein HPP92_018359 [Vanilla planifolia]